jgi:plasmid maintenance system killer protein
MRWRMTPSPALERTRRGLARLFETGSRSGIQARHVDRLRLILGRLHAAASGEDMSLPGLRLHPLKGREREHGVFRLAATGA